MEIQPPVRKRVGQRNETVSPVGGRQGYVRQRSPQCTVCIKIDGGIQYQAAIEFTVGDVTASPQNLNATELYF